MQARHTSGTDRRQANAIKQHPCGGCLLDHLLVLGEGGDQRDAVRATAGTVTVTLLPTAAGEKTLKKTRRPLRVVLLIGFKEAKTSQCHQPPAKTLTLKR